MPMRSGCWLFTDSSVPLATSSARRSGTFRKVWVALTPMKWSGICRDVREQSPRTSSLLPPVGWQNLTSRFAAGYSTTEAGTPTPRQNFWLVSDGFDRTLRPFKRPFFIRMYRFHPAMAFAWIIAISPFSAWACACRVELRLIHPPY